MKEESHCYSTKKFGILLFYITWWIGGDGSSEKEYLAFWSENLIYWKKNIFLHLSLISLMLLIFLHIKVLEVIFI